MANAFITNETLEDIADAIRAKTGSAATMLPSEMAGNIANIPGSATLTTKSITQNGTYDASDDSADGYSSVTVNVSGGGSQTFPQLWVNSSPSSNFAAQTIQIDLSGYNFIIVRGKYGTGDSATDANFLFPNANRMQALVAVGTSGELKYGGNNNYARGITVTTTGVTFAAATASANQYCIPLSIYGVKGSFGGAS